MTLVWGEEFLIYLTFVSKTTPVILLLALCAGEGNPDVSDICCGGRGNHWGESFFFPKLYLLRELELERKSSFCINIESPS